MNLKSETNPNYRLNRVQDSRDVTLLERSDIIETEKVLEKKVVQTLFEKEKHGETEWKCSLRTKSKDEDCEHDGILHNSRSRRIMNCKSQPIKLSSSLHNRPNHSAARPEMQIQDCEEVQEDEELRVHSNFLIGL